VVAGANDAEKDAVAHVLIMFVVEQREPDSEERGSPSEIPCACGVHSAAH
jgi:hypothetical protein